MTKKEFKPTNTTQTLHPVTAEEPAKPKRSSIIRRRRAGSMKARPTSVTSLNSSGCHRTQSEKCTSTDVSILVTEASPEGANTAAARPLLHRQNSEATVVQVLVHRESEEYNNDEEERVESESQQSNISQIENIRTTEYAPTIDSSQLAVRDVDASTIIDTSIVDAALASDDLSVREDTTTDVVIDIDSNMSS